MNHRAASELLADYRQNRLDAEARAEVTGHIAACAACREWLETYDLMGRALAEDRRLEHPDAEDLAAWAAAGGEPAAEVASHVESCAACRREAGLVEAAIAAARGPRQRRAAAPWAFLKSGRAAAGWAVAGLALIILAGTVLSRPAGDAGRDRVISGGTLTGDETVMGRSIYASDVRIEGGSKIVFEAEDVVTFGDGFEVAADASLEVGRVRKAGV